MGRRIWYIYFRYIAIFHRTDDNSRFPVRRTELIQMRVVLSGTPDMGQGTVLVCPLILLLDICPDDSGRSLPERPRRYVEHPNPLLVVYETHDALGPHGIGVRIGECHRNFIDTMNGCTKRHTISVQQHPSQSWDDRIEWYGPHTSDSVIPDQTIMTA